LPTDRSIKALSEIRFDGRLDGQKLPPDISQDVFGAPQPDGRLAANREDWAETYFAWEPAEFSYQPLYFSDVPLERYGQSWHPCLQPFVSAAHFGLTFPAMPYKLALEHPYRRVSSYGLYRPGSAVPPIRQTLPLRWDAASVEAAVWIGLIFALP
jgi:hypothetical protein